jgi:cell division protein FtsB
MRRRLGSLAPAAALFGVAAVIVAGLALLPIRSWVDQRDARSQAEVELTRTNGEVDELKARLALLETDTEIERLARENFDLVLPGEESYRILPAPDTGTD